MKQTTDELKSLLLNFVEYEDGLAIRRELKKRTLNSYKPKYPSLYIKFMDEHDCSFTALHAQDRRPNVLALFSVCCQHVYGDCVSECLDLAIGKINYEGVNDETNNR